MIHTFTIKYQINANEYWEFKNSAHTKCYKCDKNNDNYNNSINEYTLENRLLEEMGIVLYACKYKVPNRPDYFCYEMFVNPTKVLGRKKVVEIYKADMFEDFMQQFNYIIQNYEVKLPPLEDWIAKRIDFTKDIKTEHVKLYIKLFQKSNLKNYKFPKDKNNNIVRFRDGSLYCKRKNHSINFYNKRDEMINQMKKGRRIYTDDELEQAKDILRIEIQCHKSKLLSLKNKYDLNDRNIIPFLLKTDISEEVIKYYVKKLLGTADYYKKPGAILKIKQSKYNTNIKNNMIQLIEDVSRQYSSIDKVLENYENIRELLKKFDEIGINPVTINKNIKLSVKLKAIYHLI